MKFIPLRGLIATTHGSMWADGFAVEIAGYEWLHTWVTEYVSTGSDSLFELLPPMFIVSHWETGRKITTKQRKTKEEAAIAAAAFLDKMTRSEIEAAIRNAK